MRPCGDCRLCCKIFPLPVLDKPAGAWCRHVGAAGCEIHGPRTPDVCRQYDCYLREHEALSESWRPDRIGIVVTEAGSVTVGYRVLPVVFFQEDFAEDASGNAAGRCGRGICSIIRPARRGRDDHPRLGSTDRVRSERWPGISADDIEAALRYEFSQDAEELKRLGAVGDEYRPLSRDEAEAACREERTNRVQSLSWAIGCQRGKTSGICSYSLRTSFGT